MICFLPLLAEAILIYLHHNFGAIAAMKINVRELVPIDAFFFQTFINIQGGFAFFVALLVGRRSFLAICATTHCRSYLCPPFHVPNM